MSAPAEPQTVCVCCMCAHVFVLIYSAIFRPVNVYGPLCEIYNAATDDYLKYHLTYLVS